MKMFKYIKYYLGIDKVTTILYLFIKLAEASFLSIETLLIARLLDQIMDNLSNSRAIIQNVLLLLGMWGCKRGIAYFGQKTWIHLRRATYVRLPEKIIEKKKNISYEKLENKEVQELLRRISNDLEGEFCKYFDNNIYLLKNLVEIVGVLLLISIKSAWVAVIMLGILASYVFVAIKNGKISYEAYEDSEEMFREAEYYKSVINQRNYSEERALFQYGGYFNKLWSDKYKDAIRVENKANWRVLSKIELSNALSTIIVAGIFFLLACSPIGKTMTIGFLISVMKSLINYIDTVSSDMAKRVATFEKGLLFLGDIEKFDDIDEQHSDIGGEREMHRLDCIEFRDVSFAYPGSKEKVFDHLNLKLQGNKHYAIVGENGAGKSTLLKLLMGVYQDYTGSITINGTDIREIPLVKLQKCFAYVPQDFTKYEIALDEYLQEKDIDRINKMLNEYEIDYIRADKEMPILGKIEEGAMDLSGGQWQQLAVVRVSLSDRSMIVLDEPTAAIDPIKEQKIYALFKKVMEERFTILVTHRLGAAKMSDEIIVLASGKVLEQGVHADLIRQKSKYHEMFLNQRSWYETEEA